ncbi:hypothetical protein NL676_013413 [Syzygium grande]|nr:hypothetical protein NL676_013413 [Syzygium grande]
MEYMQWANGNAEIDQLKRFCIAYDYVEAEKINENAVSRVEQIKGKISELDENKVKMQVAPQELEKKISDLSAQKEASMHGEILSNIEDLKQSVEESASAVKRAEEGFFVNFVKSGFEFSQAESKLLLKSAHTDNFAAKRMRKLTQRRAVDYTSTVVQYTQLSLYHLIRMWQRDSRDRTGLQPTPAASIDMLPAVAYSDNPSTSFAAKFVHTSANKNHFLQFRNDSSGTLSKWWSHNDNWMVSGDDGGSIKYRQNNMNNVRANKSAHRESVRDLSFCRKDLKFCSCSDDTTVRVRDFAPCQEERSLSGHGWDVKSVDWHPTKSLFVSEYCALCQVEPKWKLGVNCHKDQIIKLYDIWAMKELESIHEVNGRMSLAQNSSD